jgi:exodeoxyribonuclease V alpha subunit
MAVLNGVLEHITYSNQDTGYTVARVATERGGRPGHRGRPG